MDLQHIVPETERAQPRFRLGQFDRIRIEADQPSARGDRAQDFKRMASVAEGGVDRDLARLRREDFQDFPDHDRSMHAGGRLAAGQDLFDMSAP